MALVKVVRDNPDDKAERLVTMFSRQLGYKSTSRNLAGSFLIAVRTYFLVVPRPATEVFALAADLGRI
ncbi:MAG: hypothetical protein DI597_03615 [Pseudoxanthomonas spadix]|nr:MAG: hypothetical protein DI597_03615 [Pseudoxanthomonas spadix]